ncbi:hypothetical protein RUM43_010960 [Polyplax serrata]|uniref:Uncharacterized protein n=1 Tax=Polyplax serrata TaxID=468196 RepID=A0AAN8NLA0_POLSC
MKKVLKFVKGKKDERKDESGGLTPSQSGDLISPAQTPEDERFLGLDSSFGYVVDFNGKDKSLTKLHKAAWQGNLDKLKSALKKVDIDASDKHNRTALHFAVVQGHPNIVWFLLGNNANTSVCDDDGCTPLLKAIECGHKECLKLLLERSTDINATDYTGNTGLHVAVKQGSLDIVSVLLSKNANTEVSNNAGDYPLHIATKSENKDLVDLLVNSGADVNVLDRENRTPLMLAAKSGNALLTDLFVEYGSQLTVVDSNGWAADDYALLGGHDDIASSLKALIRAKKEKSKEIQGVHEQNAASESNKEDENSVSWGDNPSSNSSDKTDRVAKKLKEFFRTCSKDEETGNEAIALAKPKDKEEDTIESPNSEVMPPFCQPPRSWDMIQAGMIDGNKPGSETKRLGITTLGTLHSRRESFTEGQSVNSPRFTLSLNRRKGAKGSNSFAKQRLSFNEEVTLKQMTFENSKIRSDDKAPVVAAAVVSRNITGDDPETDVNCKSMDVKEVPSDISDGIQPADSSDWDSSEKDSGTLGRPDTMKMSEEIWVSETKEAGFPSPPSALELGADMARSLKYMKGVSEDYPLGSTAERNLWRNAYETHSLDCLEEKSHVESGRLESEVGYFQQQSTSSLRWKSQEIPRRQKSLDRLVDVNKRINEQLECYDQALRELAETSTRKNSLSAASEKSFNSVNYYSLPSSKVRVTDGDTERNSVPKMRPTGKPTNGGPCRTPPQTSTCLTAEKCDNNEELGQEHRETVKVNEEADVRKAKRQILMAMRDVKHAIQVSSVFKTSFDDQVLSPLTKPENSVELDDSDSPKRTAGDTEKGSPQGLAFFSLGRQETVLERKSSSSGTDEPTLWLQNNGHGKQDNGSDEDVSEISEERGHKRVSPFSPLGVIYQEIKNERRSDEKDSPVELDDINLKTEGGGVRSSLFRRFK